MAVHEASISINIDSEGTIVLRVADSAGYGEKVRKLLTAEDAHEIATFIDNRCNTTYYCRNIISDAVKSRRKRIKDLQEARARIEKQLEELEK